MKKTSAIFSVIAVTGVAAVIGVSVPFVLKVVNSSTSTNTESVPQPQLPEDQLLLNKEKERVDSLLLTSKTTSISKDEFNSIDETNLFSHISGWTEDSLFQYRIIDFSRESSSIAFKIGITKSIYNVISKQFNISFTISSEDNTTPNPEKPTPEAPFVQSTQKIDTAQENGDVTSYRVEIIGTNLSLNVSNYRIFDSSNNEYHWTLSNESTSSKVILVSTIDLKESKTLTLRVYDSDKVIYSHAFEFEKFQTTLTRVNTYKEILMKWLESISIKSKEQFEEQFNKFQESVSIPKQNGRVTETLVSLDYDKNFTSPIQLLSFSVNYEIKSGDDIGTITYTFKNPEPWRPADPNKIYASSDGFVVKNSTIINYQGNSTSLKIPDSFVHYDEGTGIKTLVDIINIGDNVFKAKKLTKITLNSKIKTIGKYAFAENKLTNIHFPKTLATIEEGAFSSNELSYVDFSGTSLWATGLSAFKNNKISNANFGTNITMISDHSFENNKFTTYNFSKTKLNRIGEYAFAYNLWQLDIAGKTGHNTIELPSTLTEMGVASFEVEQKYEWQNGNLWWFADLGGRFYRHRGDADTYWKTIVVTSWAKPWQKRWFLARWYFNALMINYKYYKDTFDKDSGKNHHWKDYY